MSLVMQDTTQLSSQQMLPGDLESDMTGGRLQELVPKAEEVARGLNPV